jgi:hypothetical protein
MIVIFIIQLGYRIARINTERIPAAHPSSLCVAKRPFQGCRTTRLDTHRREGVIEGITFRQIDLKLDIHQFKRAVHITGIYSVVPIIFDHHTLLQPDYWGPAVHTPSGEAGFRSRPSSTPTCRLSTTRSI